MASSTAPTSRCCLDKFEADGDARSRIGGFVQDSWSIADKVTVNLGVRYDAQLLYGSDGRLAMSLPEPVVPARRRHLRLHPVRPGPKLFANYARYYESVPLNMVDRTSSPASGTCSSVPRRGPCATLATRPASAATPATTTRP